MRGVLAIFFAIFFCLFGVESFAQKKIFERINTNNGLPSDEAVSTFQDKEGYLWFCTHNGLVQYDGYDLKLIQTHDSLDFSSMTFKGGGQRSDGKIWLGSRNGGVFIYDRKSGDVQKFVVDEIPNMNVMSLLVDSKDRVWIATTTGVVLVESNDSTTVFNRSNSRGGGSFSWTTSVVELNTGQIVITSWDGRLHFYKEKEKQFNSFRLRDLVESNQGYEVWSIYCDSDNNIWCSMWNDGVIVVRYQESDEQLKFVKHFHSIEGVEQSLSSPRVYSVCEGKKDEFWIGTSHGLNVLKSPFSKNPTIDKIYYSAEDKSSISYNYVFHIFKDRSNIMWISTNGGGVNKFDPEGLLFSTIELVPDSNKQERSQKLKCVFADNDGNLYASFSSTGLTRYDANDNIFKPVNSFPKFKRFKNNPGGIDQMITDSLGNIWMGGNNQLIVTNPKTKKRKFYKNANSGFRGKTVQAFSLGPDKSVYVATNRGIAIARHKPRRFSVTMLKANPENFTRRFMQSLLVDKDYHLWFGTKNAGLYRSDNSIAENDTLFTFKSFEAYTNRKLEFDKINSIKQDANGNLWIGGGGNKLYCYNQTYSKLVHYGTQEGLDCEEIFDIIILDDGAIWLSTNNGLFSLTLNSDSGAYVRKFTVDDGLQGNNFVKGNAFKDRFGNLYFGGFYGINKFNPNDIKYQKVSPSVVLTEIQVMDEPVSQNFENDKLVLDHKQNYLSISFSALSFSHQNKNRFAYKLIGFQDDWFYTDASFRRAVYSNLDPGDYTFRVKAANSHGVWSKEPVELKIRVKPAPLKSNLAYAIYVILILSAIVVINRIIVDRVKLRQAVEIEAVKLERTEKLNQFKLRFFTNISHELLTPMSILLCLIEEKINKQKGDASLNLMKRNINKLIYLTKQLLEFRKVETENLKLSVAKMNISSFVNEVFESFKPLARKQQIEFSQFVDQNIHGYVDSDKLNKILYNLLSNAFKYTGSLGLVLFSVAKLTDKESETMEITIKDSGPGIPEHELDKIFDRYYRLTSSSSKEIGTGIGLALTKKLVDLHHGKINVESKVGEGTSFFVRIPISKNGYKNEEISASLEHNQNVRGLVDPDEIGVEGISNLPDMVDLKKDTKLLFVEDDIDLRETIQFRLKEHYRVIVAKDGQEGFEMAMNESPDIVLTDVKMPRMDGNELCRKVKNTFELSHIPVIMLTANIAENSRMEGYYAGADSYIAKPVTVNTLVARIDSLLKLRQQLKDRYKGNLVLEPKDVKITNGDEKFISRVKQSIEENISNQNFSVKDLYELMGTSNSMLYRKLTSLVGLTPQEFIKTIRLNRASQLLQQGALTVSEVAYEVGFNDPGYFSTSFRKKFGKTPTEYINDYVN